MKQVILTADRPTGRLHIGHFVGSLARRVELQNSGQYQTFVMIADWQALTDNARQPNKVHDSVLEVALDYLAVGLDPAKSTIFIQSQIPALSELTMYFMNLVSISRLERNPTVKTEIQQKHFGEGVPTGFVVYPISQAADITAFNTNLVPVGADQLPMIEQCREIVRTFNQIYGDGRDILVEPTALLPDNPLARRLPGIDGNAKMGKSLANGIYLSDDADSLHQKVMSMYTDPGHIHVDNPGKIDGNVVFTYLDIFAPNDSNVADMKRQYQQGGLGDVKVKKYLLEVLENVLQPIRQRRAELARDPSAVYQMLQAGSKQASITARQTLQKVRTAVDVEYFA
jgi:tryptophanyl-tRNA synthetase